MASSTGLAPRDARASPQGDRAHVAVPSTYQQEQDYRVSLGTTANFSIFVGFRLRGAVDLRHVQQTLDAIAVRHDVLRTSLRQIDGQIMQVVAPRVEVPMQFVTLDGSRGRGHGRGRRLERLVQQALDQPFDLARSPLIRAILIRLGPVDHVLGLVVPHTIWDSACRRAFAREFVNVYDAVSADASPPPGPSIQIGDFAHWQRTLVDGAAQAYWHQRLAGAPAQLGLPLDREGAARRGYRVRVVPLPDLSPSLSYRLQDAASSACGMVAMTLTATTAILLSAHTGQVDVTMALMHANRMLPETEGMLGFIADVLPLRIYVRPNESFRETVRHVVEATRDAYRHMLPSGKLRELLASCDVMVNPQQLRPSTALSTMTGLRMTDYRPETWWTMHPTQDVWYHAPIDVDFRVGGDGAIATSVSYNREALDDGTGRRLAADLGALMRRAAVAPDLSIQRLVNVRAR